MDTAEQMKKAIEEADMVLVGIGEEWETDYKKMEEKEPYSTLLAEIREKENTRWLVPFLRAHYLKHETGKEKEDAYQALFRLVEGKNYFIVSVCMDGKMQKEKWKENRTVFPCGGYEQLQCSECDAPLQDGGEWTEQIWNAAVKSAGALEKLEAPVCERCGKPLCFHNVLEQSYHEKGYLPDWETYRKWLQGTMNRKLCILELGVGMKFPSVIRFPFEKLAYFNQKASFFRVHSRLYQMSAELAGKGVSIEAEASEWLKKLM